MYTNSNIVTPHYGNTKLLFYLNVHYVYMCILTTTVTLHYRNSKLLFYLYVHYKNGHAHSTVLSSFPCNTYSKIGIPLQEELMQGVMEADCVKYFLYKSLLLC